MENGSGLCEAVCTLCATELVEPGAVGTRFGASQTVSLVMVDDREFPVREFAYCVVKYMPASRQSKLAGRTPVDNERFMEMMLAVLAQPETASLLAGVYLDDGGSTKWVAEYVSGHETAAASNGVGLAVAALVRSGVVSTAEHVRVLGKNGMRLLYREPSRGRQMLVTKDLPRYVLVSHLLNGGTGNRKLETALGDLGTRLGVRVRVE